MIVIGQLNFFIAKRNYNQSKRERRLLSMRLYFVCPAVLWLSAIFVFVTLSLVKANSRWVHFFFFVWTDSLHDNVPMSRTFLDTDSLQQVTKEVLSTLILPASVMWLLLNSVSVQKLIIYLKRLFTDWKSLFPDRWSITPIMYPGAFYFSEASSAYVFMIVVNMFFGVTATVTTFILQLFPDDLVWNLISSCS